MLYIKKIAVKIGEKNCRKDWKKIAVKIGKKLP
jgi:hypothetical protein